MRTFDKWGFEHTDQFGKSATAKTLEQAIEIAEEMNDDYLNYPMDLPKAQGGDGSNLITITDSSGDVVWENPRNNPEEYSGKLHGSEGHSSPGKNRTVSKTPTKTVRKFLNGGRAR